MKLKLSIEERILLFSLLPRKSDYETLNEIIEARDALTFTEEETRKFDITTSFPSEFRCSACSTVFNNQNGIVPSALDGKYYCPVCESGETTLLSEDKSRQNIAFNKEVAGDYTKQITIKPRILAEIVGVLEETSKKKELTEQLLPIYKKLVLA